jgi:hypothetical protein
VRILLLALVLAGCLAPAVPASVATGGAPALALTGCENLSGSFPVPAADARAVLPTGFQPRQADPAGSIFWIVSVHCAGSQIAGVDAGEAWFSYGELDVTAPARYQIEGVADYTVPLFALAQPQAVVDALVALGLPHVALSDTTTQTLATGGKRVTIASAEGGFEMVGQPTTGEATLGEGAWGMFGVQDRAVVSSIRGSASGGVALSSALAQTSDGSLPLMQSARPAARGGMVGGFDLAFERVS